MLDQQCDLREHIDRYHTTNLVTGVAEVVDGVFAQIIEVNQQNNPIVRENISPGTSTVVIFLDGVL